MVRVCQPLFGLSWHPAWHWLQSAVERQSSASTRHRAAGLLGRPLLPALTLWTGRVGRTVQPDLAVVVLAGADVDSGEAVDVACGPLHEGYVAGPLAGLDEPLAAYSAVGPPAAAGHDATGRGQRCSPGVPKDVGMKKG